MNDSKPEMRSNHLNISEYNALRQEVLERIKLMNSQNTGAMTVIIALWAAGFTLMGMRFGIGTRSIPIAMGLCWGESITFFIVIPILSSMAVRSAENIRQIAAIGAYIRVFFESIPSVKGCAYGQSDWFFWESADSVASGLKSHCLRSNLSFHNREYLWLASTSAILWIVSLVRQ